MSFTEQREEKNSLFFYQKANILIVWRRFIFCFIHSTVYSGSSCATVQIAHELLWSISLTASDSEVPMTFPPYFQWPPTLKRSVLSWLRKITVLSERGEGILMKCLWTLSVDPTRSRRVKISPRSSNFLPFLTLPRKTQFPLISDPRKSLWMGQTSFDILKLRVCFD